MSFTALTRVVLGIDCTVQPVSSCCYNGELLRNISDRSYGYDG